MNLITNTKKTMDASCVESRQNSSSCAGVMAISKRLTFVLRPLPLLIALSLGMSCAPAGAQLVDPSLTEIGALNGGEYSEAFGINAIGDVIVGYSYDGAAGNASRAFIWTSTGGMVSLGTLNGGNYSSAWGVNTTGDVVVGQAHDGDASNQSRAFRWTDATGMVSLGILSGGTYSSARDVNAAGDVVVGTANDGDSHQYAFRWTEATGMISLGTLNGGSNSEASGVNSAGDVIVGKAYDGAASNQERAFRWTEATGMVSLGVLSGGDRSSAEGVNAAGNLVVGWSNSTDGYRAFSWTDATGMVSLGTLNGGNYSVASGVNSAGDVVVGQANDGAAGNAYRAMRWTQATGMQSIEEWLTTSGVTVNPDAVKTYRANATNVDGSVIVGVLHNDQAFIARAGSGMVDTEEYMSSLGESSGVSSVGMQTASLIMHGAHSNPMRGLLTESKQDFWVAGDVGHMESEDLSGRSGLGEIGIAHGINDDVMVKVALGRTYSRQDTVYDGLTRVDGTYIMPELIAKVKGTPLYATLSAYYHWGDAEIKRGYDNAGNPDYSTGNPDANTYSVRVRFDWLNAVEKGKTAFTPYASISYTKSKVDGYTETDGGFPATWGDRDEHTTAARIGLDMVHKLDDKLNLLGRVEGAHLFNDKGANASVTVPGVLATTIESVDYKRNWLRVGAGVDGKLGDGTVSVMLNGTTQSNGLDYWLAASYRVPF